MAAAKAERARVVAFIERVAASFSDADIALVLAGVADSLKAGEHLPAPDGGE
jgi:hypothetical protein